MLDQHRRSILKTISWRILATLATMSIVFIFTRQWVLSLGVGVVEVAVKMTLYYFHERAWGRVKWGRQNHPLEHLPVRKKLKPEDASLLRQQLESLGYLEVAE